MFSIVRSRAEAVIRMIRLVFPWWYLKIYSNSQLFTHFPEMNLPAAIPLSLTNIDVSSSEDATIALSSITFNSSPPSLLGYSENIGHTAASVENPGGDAGRGTDTAPEAKSKTLKSREYIQLATLCWFVYLEGWNDGTNGPLLPRIQRVYNVRL